MTRRYSRNDKQKNAALLLKLEQTGNYILTLLQTTVPTTALIARHSRVQHQSNPAQLTARLALDWKTKQDCYKLRYLSYFAEGYIDPRRSKMFSDEYDEQSASQTVVIYKGSRAVASTRICMVARSPDGSTSGAIPAQHVFPEETENLLRHDATTPVERIVEINRLVRHPDFAEDKTLVFLLFRLAGHFILKQNAGVVVSCVRRNHVPFYTRLRFNDIAGPRVYHGVKFATHLLSCPRPQYAAVRRMVPVLDVTEAAQARYDRLSQGETIAVLS